MPRPVGIPKTGGRKKGTPNRVTQDLRELLEARNIHIPEQIFDLLPQLDVEKRVDVLLVLMSYIYPKRKAIEHSGTVDVSTPIELTHERFNELLSDPELLRAAETLAARISSDA